MKRHTTSLLLLFTCLLVLFDALWLHPRAARAQGTLRVYVQQVKEKHWTDIQGTEIVGFSCVPYGGSTCYVASR